MESMTMRGPVGSTTFLGYFRQPKLLQWRHPPPGFVAVNCDGSFRNWKGTGGYGVIVRDHYGRFIMAKANCFHKTDLLKNQVASQVEYGVIVLMIEMLAIRDGLRLAKKLELRQVEIQSDSKVAISILHGHVKCPIECHDVYWSILREVPFFRGLGFVFVYRESNRAADFLSKLLTGDGERCLDSSQLPHQLRNIIIKDGLGVPTARFSMVKFLPVCKDTIHHWDLKAR